MAVSIFWKLFGFSLTSVPICMLCNKIFTYLLELGFYSSIIALTGILLLAFYISFVYWICKNSSNKTKIRDPFFYVFALFSFTSVIDFCIGLELDGYISNFLTEYLKDGEPYLTSPYGGIICYFDGFAMYSMYLYMMYAILNKKSYRSVGIYWAGTLINSMIVLVFGILTGRHGVYPATIMNLPYTIFPFIVLWKLLQEKPKLLTSVQQKSLSQRPLDIAFICMLIFTASITILKGLVRKIFQLKGGLSTEPNVISIEIFSHLEAVLDDKLWFVKFYWQEIEPFLRIEDPCPFPKIQMIQNLFYLLPMQIYAICALSIPGCSWMPDIMLYYAGAIAQGQFAHMLTAIHSGIPDTFRIPEEIGVRNVFWTINLLYTIIPHLILIRCLHSPDFFAERTKQSVNKNAKSK